MSVVGRRIPFNSFDYVFAIGALEDNWMPLEWWGIFAFAVPFALAICAPDLRVLGVGTTVLGAVIAAAWGWLRREMSAPNDHSSFGDAVAVGVLVAAAAGLICGAFMRLAIFELGRSLRRLNRRN
jgi:hypothetical protein